MWKTWSGWVLLAGVTVAGCGPQLLPTDPQTPTQPVVVRDCARQNDPQVIDLTQPLHNDTVAPPGGTGFTLTEETGYDAGYRSQRYAMGDNVGTYVDSPSHLFEGKRTIGQIPTSELMVPVVVINVRAKVQNNPDYELAATDVVDWEAIHGPLPIGAVLIVNTGWYERFNDADKYLNRDAEGVMHFPGFSKAAAQLLVDRDVVGIGIDTASTDRGASPDNAVHHVMLGAGKYQIANLNNLNALPEKGATLIVGVLPVSDGVRAQARVLALVPEQTPESEEEETP